MDLRFSSWRGAGAWLLAMLVTLAVTLLWLPQRHETRGAVQGQAPDVALLSAGSGVQPLGQMQRDKGATPRATLLATPGGDERSPGPFATLPGAGPTALAPHLTGPAAALSPAALPCPQPRCGAHRPRAPPLA